VSPPKVSTQVTIDGRRLSLSNLDKVLYPAVGFTKGQVIDYYARIAPVLVRHAAGRPMTLKRYPNGVQEKFFFEKNCPDHRPDFVDVAPVWSGHSKRNINFCLVNEVATAVWLANMAALELHASLAVAPAVEAPTAVVFDLDPGPPAGLAECCEVALAIRELIGHLGLKAIVKTSGQKGMQLYVPLNTATSYDETKPFALAVAQYMERQQPGLVVSNMAKEVRTGKVFIDWSQNDEHKTTVQAYSLRATDRPMVSAPISWEEVEAGRDDPDSLRFDSDAVLARVENLGDLFAPFVELTQELPELQPT
jgi:bifunctional non-homologous end joining protein LigD